jgi:hypothetical protein
MTAGQLGALLLALTLVRVVSELWCHLLSLVF